MIESVSLDKMKKLHEAAGLGDAQGRDYIYVRCTPQSESPRLLGKAIRFDGMIITLVRSGRFACSVNMEPVVLTDCCLMVTGSNSIITFDSAPAQNLDAHVLFVSRNFMEELNIEVTVLNQIPANHRPKPYNKISEADLNQLVEYLELLDINARQYVPEGQDVLAKGISRSLLTAALYQLMLTSMRSESLEPDAAEERPRSRRVLYTHEFVRLVQQNFRSQHAVKFYADRLCISPKYLSLVVKETTGRSAAEIIDDHLLLEAKNLLRFSGKNIQQVAYELNFSNQSSFGKYFKHLTGQSPSEFQNS